MKKLLLICTLFTLSFKIFAQNIGIGTTTPNATAVLHVDLSNNYSKGFLVTGLSNINATVPDLGGGSRMMFYPGKSAFRAGFTGSQWNNSNVGFGSVGLGGYTKASGDYSIALGLFSTASGYGSTATGNNTVASGVYSTAIGSQTEATGDYSMAAGSMVSTNGHKGAFFFGDSNPYNNGIRPIGFDDQIAMRFNGGYYFISSDGGGVDIGVSVLHGGNSWVAISDVKLKENFIPVDGESFLQKISKMPLTTWNYKTQDPKTFRHYGPMAQDFYAAFGKDDLGTIGCDTLINQQDFLGVNLIAIQALEKRTETLASENEKLKSKNELLEYEIAELKKRLDKIEAVKRH